MCGDVRHLLDLYVSGDLDDDQIAQVEEHLAACEDCSREADEYRARLDDLALLGSARQADALPPFFWQGIQKEILLGAEAAQVPCPWWRSRAALAAAAAIVIAIIAFVFIVAQGGADRIAQPGRPGIVADSGEDSGSPPFILPPGTRLLPGDRIVPAGKAGKSDDEHDERSLEF